eukprot:c21694_g1_i1 orf=280-1566(-)
MILLQEKGGAIAMMVLSLWCLGSWPVFFNILERRGRLPQHTYLDYAISTFSVAAIFAFTIGEIGGHPSDPNNFIGQLLQIRENALSASIAMLSGLALCIGNIAVQYSLAFLGISLTEVVSASVAVIGGTTINYFLDNGLNRAKLLFPGVGCFLIAAILGSFCHASNAADINAKLNLDTLERFTSKQDSSKLMHNTLLTEKLLESSCSIAGLDVENDGGSKSVGYSIPEFQLEDVNAEAGSAEFLHHVECSRAIKVKDSSVVFGLAIAFFTGACYALFSPVFNIATNDQFHTLKQGVAHLSVYTAFFYFSFAFLVFAVTVNLYFLYHPVLGVPRSSFSAYIMDQNGRTLAVMAGIVCGLGNGLQFMGGQAAGYAAAGAVQALPLVGTFWGVLLFGEYHNSSRQTYLLLAGMLTMFVIATGTLIASSHER